jgi:radical SAM-linked protein
MRVRVHYRKQEAVRFIGHLDLYRAWERLIRRAGLPLAYTQGFNPHPRINLSPALPLGFTSECELIDIWLAESVALDALKTSLLAAAPPALQIQQVEEIEDSEPAVQNIITSVEYHVHLEEPPENIAIEIQRVLSAANLPRLRRNKQYDLRPLIEAINTESCSDGSLVLHLQLACRDGATGRPDEVLNELGYPPHLALIHRTKFIFSEQPGAIA